MIQPIPLINNVYGIKVSESAINFNFYRINNYAIMLEWDDPKRPLNPFTIVKVDEYYGNLYDYKWPQLICMSGEVTEGELMLFHELQHHNFKEWFINFERRNSYFTNRVDSLRSLLTSKGLNPDNTLLIQKINA